jgi:hypothetical protein
MMAGPIDLGDANLSETSATEIVKVVLTCGHATATNIGENARIYRFYLNGGKS